MNIINSKRNLFFIDLLIANINKKSIADCIFLILNVNNISIFLEIKDIKENLIQKLLDVLLKNKNELENEFQELIKKFKLPKMEMENKNEFDFNRYYFYDEKINVNIFPQILFFNFFSTKFFPKNFFLIFFLQNFFF